MHYQIFNLLALLLSTPNQTFVTKGSRRTTQEALAAKTANWSGHLGHQGHAMGRGLNLGQNRLQPLLSSSGLISRYIEGESLLVFAMSQLWAVVF